jgi:hypothetical protein
VIVAHSVLITWLFNSTGGSLLIAILCHASMNLALTTLPVGQDNLAESLRTWAVIAAVVLVFRPGDLACQPRTICHDSNVEASRTPTQRSSSVGHS